MDTFEKIISALRSDLCVDFGKATHYSRFDSLFIRKKDGNEVLYEVRGIKDFMLVYEVINHFCLVLSDSNSALYEKCERLKKCILKVDNVEVPVICKTDGVYNFGGKGKNIDCRYKHVLLTCDYTEPVGTVYYTNPSLRYEGKVGNRHEENVVSIGGKLKCWKFCDYLKGQTRLSPNIGLVPLMKDFNRAEVWYLCYLLQFSAITWVKYILDCIKNVDSLNGI